MSIKKIETNEEFASFVEEIKSAEGYKNPIGFAIGRVDRGYADTDKVLQITFPTINWNENFGSGAIFLKALEQSGVEVDFTQSELVFDIKKKFIKHAMAYFNPFLDVAVNELHKNVQVVKELSEISKEFGLNENYKIVFIFEDTNPKSVEAVYLKLYALSNGKAPLRSLNLNGAFGVLENVAWIGDVPVELSWLRENEIKLKLQGSFPKIDWVDKFPRYLQHVIPADNTRILDTAKVRMGAHLAAGTTVMPGASYINFNAGTTGAVMVEGRVSSSVVVGSGSDVGGGASILGVLSGTNGNPVGIGENTLLGANSVTGIPLGDGCIVDAGIAILEGTKVTIKEKQLEKIQEVNPSIEYEKGKGSYVFKGLDLAGFHGIHFRQDSIKGTIIGLRSQREIKLNSDLH